MSKYPPCLGLYSETDTICNGDNTATNFEDIAHCAWRDRCAGLKIYLDTTKTDQVEFTSVTPFNALVRLCQKYVADYEIVDGKATKGQKIEVPIKKPNLEYKQNDNKALNSSFVSQERMHKVFTTTLGDMFHNQRIAKPGKLVFDVGTLYYIDRRIKSGYLSWYCKTDTKKDQAIASLSYQPTKKTMSIKIPATIDDIYEVSRKSFDKLKIKPLPNKSGQLRSVCRGVDIEKIGLVVGLLRSLHVKGKLILPKYRNR